MTIIRAEKLIAAVLGFGLGVVAHAQAVPPDHPDLIYATVGDRALELDLYVPVSSEPPPLVVWLHGGAWRAGSKANPPAQFVASGFALASLEFRPATEAPFPAMIHDIKAGIRFLRANAERYGYDADRIAIAGVSSGAHLAALVGVTNGHPELEGTIGDHVGISSAVRAIVSYFGASNLTTILQQSTPAGLRIREPSLESLLGGTPDALPELARLASPVMHVDAADPPLHLLHGDQDTQMPINQSHELHHAYKLLGLDVGFDVVHEAGHGGAAFFNGEHWERTAAFLHRVLTPD